MSGGSSSVITNEAWKSLDYRLAWRGFPGFGKNSGFLNVGAFDEGVLVMDTANTVSMLNQRTGKTIWITQPGTPRTKFVGSTIADGQVYCSSDIEVYVLDFHTGALVDRQSLSSVVEMPPVIIDQMAIFGSTSGEVIGHSLYSGFRLWGYQLQGSIEAAPVNVGGVVGVVSEAGDVIFLDPSDGTSRGRGSVFGGVRNRLVADDRTMYIASKDQSVYAFDARDGTRLWRYRSETSLDGNPSLYDGVLYVEIPGEGMTALDALTGEVMWQSAELHGEVVGAHDGTILLWSGTTMQTADAEDGTVLSEASWPQAAGVVRARGADAPVYVLERGGSVAKFVAR
jgi:outer membrane protein assembly factor BamB